MRNVAIGTIIQTVLYSAVDGRLYKTADNSAPVLAAFRIFFFRTLKDTIEQTVNNFRVISYSDETAASPVDSFYFCRYTTVHDFVLYVTRMAVANKTCRVFAGCDGASKV